MEYFAIFFKPESRGLTGETCIYDIKAIRISLQNVQWPKCPIPIGKNVYKQYII
jgi:hypothetical protein